MFRHAMLSAAVLLASFTLALATGPQLINYQGILTNPSGDPIVVATNVTFAIWLTPTGGTPLWSEPHSITPDADGRFTVILGSVTPIPDTALSGPDAYLGVTVDSDPEMVRQQLISVPYSMRVRTVDGAGGGTINGNLRVGSNDTVFTSNLSSNSPLRLQTAGSTRVYLDDATGNVGIGTTSPTQPLDVSGTIKASALLADVAVIGQLPNDPFGLLHIAVNGTALNLQSADPGEPVELFFSDASDTPGAYGWDLRSQGTGVGASDLQLKRSDGAVAQFWSDGGNVGINTASPEATLHVAGDLKVTGDISGSIPWTSFPFAAGFSDYETAHPGLGWQVAQYRKIGDEVELRGMVHKSDHGSLFGWTIGTLPAGFRPPARVMIVCAGGTGTAGSVVDILTNGDVVCRVGVGTDYVNVSDIRFSTSP